MIAVDTNVLVYAHRAEMEQHAAALAAVTRLAEADEPWGLPVFVVNDFLRVVTHHRIFPTPSTRPQARAVVAGLLASPTARLLLPGERYLPLLDEELDAGDARGDLVLDASIVALCREHGVDSILTNDRDFRRFTAIRTISL